MCLTTHTMIQCERCGNTVYPKKYAHGFCFAVLCCGYTLTDFPISIRLTSLALWQSNDCPSASKATLMNMDKYFMWIHYERLRNHNKAKHNKTVCIFLGIYCMCAVLHSQLQSFRYNDAKLSPSSCRTKLLKAVYWGWFSIRNVTKITIFDIAAILFKNEIILVAISLTLYYGVLLCFHGTIRINHIT